MVLRLLVERSHFLLPNIKHLFIFPLLESAFLSKNHIYSCFYLQLTNALL